MSLFPLNNLQAYIRAPMDTILMTTIRFYLMLCPSVDGPDRLWT